MTLWYSSWSFSLIDDMDNMINMFKDFLAATRDTCS